jgi:hypothetical protein
MHAEFERPPIRDRKHEGSRLALLGSNRHQALKNFRILRSHVLRQA